MSNILRVVLMCISIRDYIGRVYMHKNEDVFGVMRNRNIANACTSYDVFLYLFVMATIIIDRVRKA